MLGRAQFLHPLSVGQHIGFIEEPVAPTLAPFDLTLPRELPQRHRAVACESGGFVRDDPGGRTMSQAVRRATQKRSNLAAGR